MRLGIIGAGQIVQHHLKAFSDCDVELVAIANRTKEKAETLAKEYTISKVYDDYKKMFVQEKLDAVAILTGVDTIYTITKESLESGLHCFIEKPPGLSVEEAEELTRLAEEKKLLIMVALNRRYLSTIRKAKELIKNNELKTIVIEAPERFSEIKNMNKYSQHVLDKWIYANGIHCLDLFIYFGGSTQTVTSASQDNNYQALIEFENGAVGHYYTNYDSPGNWSVILVTDKQKITIKPLEKGIFQDANGTETSFGLDQTDTNYKPGFYLQAQAFIEGVKKGKISFPACSIQEAVKTMQLIEQIDI